MTWQSAPQYIAKTFTATIEAYPGNWVDWVFEWDTEYSSDPALEQVTVTDLPRSPSSCLQGTQVLTPQDVLVSSTITPKPGGGYHHRLVWHHQTCLSGCSYRAVASSGTWNQDGTVRRSDTESKTVTMSVCVPYLQD